MMSRGVGFDPPPQVSSRLSFFREVVPRSPERGRARARRRIVPWRRSRWRPRRRLSRAFVLSARATRRIVRRPPSRAPCRDTPRVKFYSRRRNSRARWRGADSRFPAATPKPQPKPKPKPERFRRPRPLLTRARARRFARTCRSRIRWATWLRTWRVDSPRSNSARRSRRFANWRRRTGAAAGTTTRSWRWRRTWWAARPRTSATHSHANSTATFASRNPPRRHRRSAQNPKPARH